MTEKKYFAQLYKIVLGQRVGIAHTTIVTDKSGYAVLMECAEKWKQDKMIEITCCLGMGRLEARFSDGHYIEIKELN